MSEHNPAFLCYRPIREEDIVAVLDICRQTLLEHINASGGDPSLFTEAFLRETLTKSEIQVATSDEQVIGYIQYQIRPPNVIINGAALTPTSQRQGVGSRLFAHAVQRADEQGCSRVVISVQPTNAGVHATYLRVGFVEGDNPEGWNQELSMPMAQALELLKHRGLT